MKNHHERITRTSDTLQHTRDAMKISRRLPGSEAASDTALLQYCQQLHKVEAWIKKGARLSDLIGFCFRREQIGPLHVVRFVQVSCQGLRKEDHFPVTRRIF